MKVRNMESAKGNKIANQFIIEANDSDTYDDVEYFQSYDSVIVKKVFGASRSVTLDSQYWDYSVTTGKYRNQFLGETKKETEAKIKSGEYKLADLN